MRLPRLAVVFALLAPVTAAADDNLAGLQAELCGAVDPGARHSEAVTAVGRATTFTDHAADPDVPWVAKLHVIERDLPDGRVEVQNCGASVIGREWVLTAAHCLRDLEWKRVEVTVGSLDTDDARAIRSVAVDAVCHSGFEPVSMAGDVALLRLLQPLPDDLPFAPLAEVGPLPVEGSRDALVMAAGWRTRASGLPDTRLRRSYGWLDGPSDGGQVAVRPLKGDPNPLCLGESGSPLIMAGDEEGTMVALLTSVEVRLAADGSQSFTRRDCARGGFRLTFSRIGHYREWIDGVVSHCDSMPWDCEGPAR